VSASLYNVVINHGGYGLYLTDVQLADLGTWELGSGTDMWQYEDPNARDTEE
jgi:hypothetical protein